MEEPFANDDPQNPKTPQKTCCHSITFEHGQSKYNNNNYNILFGYLSCRRYIAWADSATNQPTTAAVVAFNYLISV